ncbi:MAG: hypothetical protein KatS3mg014_2455 [Actinomycetota bacterium]|nr:MAG: hypothetical protein KatS3mg014_2455 [Actinomycetota bacterium]
MSLLLLFGSGPITEFDRVLPGSQNVIDGHLIVERDLMIANAVVAGSLLVEHDTVSVGSQDRPVFGSLIRERDSVRTGGSTFGPRNRRLTAKVRPRDNPEAVLCALSTDSERALELVVSEPGSGSVAVGVADPDASCLECGRIVTFDLDGEPVGGFLVERIEVDADPRDGLPSARLRRASGRSTLAVLDHAIVYPEQGSGRLSPSTRLMNFTSSDYEVRPPWTAAVQIKRQGDSTGQWDGAPLDWPDPDAYWIWAQAQGPGSDTTPPQPVGRCYFRTQFYVGSQTPVTIFITADDGYELYLDATLVAKETKAFMWAETQTYDVLLDAGLHTIAVVGINIHRDSVSTNVAGVIVSVVERTEGGQSYGSVLVRTDNTWAALAYPPRAPGMTPGKIMQVLLDEAQARGALPGVDYLASPLRDSHGNPWTFEWDLELQVGIPLLQVARMFGELGVDVEMLNPMGLALFPRGTRDWSSSIRFTAADVHERSFTIACPSVTTLLSAFHTGDVPANFQANDTYLERADAAALAAHGRLEAFASLGSAASPDMASEESDAILRDNAWPKETVEIDVAVRRPDGSDLPGMFHGWRPGVIVGCESSDGVMSKCRITRMAIVDDPSGGPDPVVRLEGEIGDAIMTS